MKNTGMQVNVRTEHVPTAQERLVGPNLGQRKKPVQTGTWDPWLDGRKDLHIAQNKLSPCMPVLICLGEFS